MDELPKISSRDNSRLVRARRVRDGQVPDMMFIEGKRLVEEAVASGLNITECYVAERFVSMRGHHEIIDRVRDVCRSVFELPDRIFRSIADTDHSQGIILIAERPSNGSRAIEDLIVSKVRLPLVVMLSEVGNPSNLGAVIRSAEAAGSCGVIVTNRSADAFSPKSLRSAMGSAFRLPVWRDVGFEEAISWADQFGLRTTSTAADGGIPHTELDWSIPRLLIFGSEAHGLSTNDLATVRDTVAIKMHGPVESLNLAVSTGVLLFEARRQNG